MSQKDPTRRSALATLAGGAALLSAHGVARAATAPLKVGVVADFSGEYALIGKGFQQAMEVYQATRRKPDDPELQLIFRDAPGFSPARVRQVVQELVVREGVKIVAGITTSPGALAAIDVINQAKVPLVVFNASLSGVVQKSPLVIRTGLTLWEAGPVLGKFAFEQGFRKALTVVADYSAGIDAGTAYSYGFTQAGGTMMDGIRVPLATTDFAAQVQRIKDLKPDCIFVFMPAGSMPVGFARAYLGGGPAPQFFGFDEGREVNIAAIGDAAVGMITVGDYQANLDTAESKNLNKGLGDRFGSNAVIPDFLSIGAYNGMVVVTALAKAGAATDALKAVEAVKGLTWDGPQGKVSINPQTRDMVQPIFIRKVERGSDGKLSNRVLARFPDIKDAWLEQHPS